MKKKIKKNDLPIEEKIKCYLECLEVIINQEKIINSLGYKVKILIKEKH